MGSNTSSWAVSYKGIGGRFHRLRVKSIQGSTHVLDGVERLWFLICAGEGLLLFLVCVVVRDVASRCGFFPYRLSLDF